MKMPPPRADVLLLLALCFLCFFCRLGATGLLDYNEALYTEAAREMYLRGDMVTPRVNGVYFFDKPPLALWQVVLSFRAFGVNEFAARLPVAVAASLLVLLTWWFGTRYLGRRAGLLAGMMLALNPMYFGTARQMTMDIHQSLWFAAAMVCFYLGYTAPPGPGKRWYYGFWASCGLAFLAKSVPGILPIPLCAAFVALDQRLRPGPTLARLREARPLAGPLLLVALLAPWFLAVRFENGPVFFREYFWHHHVQLLTGKDFSHAQPFWYYVPALLLGFFPWSVFLPAARAARGNAAQPDRARFRLFTSVWAVGLVLLFSLMVSKLVSYLLPMYAAAALLTAGWMDTAIDDARQRAFKAGATAAGVLGLGAFLAAEIGLRRIAGTALEAKLRTDVPAGIVTFALAALALMAAGAVAAAALAWAGRRLGAVAGLAGAVAAVVALGLFQGLPALEAGMNAPLHGLAREAGRRAGPGEPVAVHIAGPVRPSVFFYLPARLLAPPGGSEDQQGILFDNGEPQEMRAYLARGTVVWVLTDSRRADELIATTPGVTIADRRDKWVLLRSSPPGREAGAGPREAPRPAPTRS